MNTEVHLWQYLVELFLEWWSILEESCRENQNTYSMFNNFFFRKSCRMWGNVEKYDKARQATDGNIVLRMRYAWWMTKATDTHSVF